MVDKNALFHELSKEIPAERYSTLCHEMGFDDSTAQIMLTKYLYDYKEALRDLLYRWDRRQGVTMKQLEDALVAAEVGGLRSIVKKHYVKDSPSTSATSEEDTGDIVQRGEQVRNQAEQAPTVRKRVNVKPIKMECCKKVGVEGGKLQLDSFGIELEIPPGAIDSEAPQDISLRVLTDTPNLSNSNAEVSVCFGVQCLAPDDLVLKLPVTYTIPHCAVSSRYSSVEAVLYTGEGEYSPDAAVKERIVLSRSGTPSVIIKKDVLILEMNHFSWAKVKFIFSQFFFREKRMCCRPFKEKNLALQRKIILHAHLYDDIKGNSELVKLEEREYFIPANMEQGVSIRTAEGDLKMTCYLSETVIGGPAVVSFDQLMSGERICMPFVLDFTNQSEDSVAVLLIVGQNENLEVILGFRLDDRRQEVSPQDQASAEVVAATGVVAGDDAAQGGTIMDAVAKDAMFDDLSKNFPAGNYSMFCNKMGVSFSEAKSVLMKYKEDYNVALRDLLSQWDLRMKGVTRKQIEVALDEAEVGGLRSIVEKHYENCH